VIVGIIHVSLIYVTYKQFSFYLTYEQFVDLSTRHTINKNCVKPWANNTRLIVMKRKAFRKI